MIPVWTYWEGKQPAWIGLCLDTIRRNVPHAKVLSRDDWAALYDGTIPANRFDQLLPNQTANIVRAWLLYRFGGVWLDADSIMFRDIRPVYDLTADSDCVVYKIGQPKPTLCYAMMASRPNGKTVKRWLELMTATVLSGKPLARNELGTRLIEQAIAEVDSCGYLPQELIAPVHWMKKDKLWRPTPLNLSPDIYGVMLGKGFAGELRTAKRRRILNSETALGDLFRRALA